MTMKKYKKIAFFLLSFILIALTTFSSFERVYADDVAYGWVKTIAGTSDEYSSSIALDSSSNVYTTGYFYGTVDFDPGVGEANLTSEGENDIFISKSDSDGNYVWTKKIGGSSYDSAKSIMTDSFDNLYIVGAFDGTVDFDPGAGEANLTSGVNSDIFILKLSSDGNYVWAKSFTGNQQMSGISLTVDILGNMYVAGFFYGTVDFDPGVGEANLVSAGEDDIFISKLDSDGNYVWAKRIGESNHEGIAFLSIDFLNNIYITGYFQGTVDFDPGVGIANLTSAGSTDMFISKLDSDGNYVWAKRVGGTGGDGPGFMVLDSSNNIYITGYFQGTVDFDPGVGEASLDQDIGGNSFILKLDSDGYYLWVKNIGGNGSAVYTTSAISDSSNNIYISGYFEFGSIADFNPGVGEANLVSVGEDDIFISKLDSDGNYVWAKRVGGTGGDGPGFMVLDSSNNIYITGYFQGTVDFDPGVGEASLTSGGDSDIFLLKLTQTFTTPPSLSSTTTASSTTDSLSLSSSITDTGGALLSERGFQYGTSESYGNTVTDIGSFDTGSYTTTISSLSCGTTYYFRSFGTNTAGTSYGAASQGMTAACPGVVFIPSGGFTPSPAPVPSPTTPPQTPIDPSTPPTEQPPTPQQPPVQEPQPVPPVSSSSFPRDIFLTSPHMEGDDVTSLQTFLHTGGYPIALTPTQERTTRSPIDGIFGPRTRSALMLFQRAKNLIVDGIFGEETRGEVERETKQR
jgi:peptidoglycan hydrolase-like protein with peptidoglycan-binding domain